MKPMFKNLPLKPTLSICVFAILSCIFMTLGCGKKASPEPPELTAPGAVKALQAAGKVDAVSLTWSAPSLNASGDELTDLGGFFVLRSEVVKGQRPQFERIADISLPTPTATDFTYADKSVKPGRAYDYQVVGFNSDGVLGPSPKVVRVNFLGESSTVEIF